MSSVQAVSQVETDSEVMMYITIETHTCEVLKKSELKFWSNRGDGVMKVMEV